MSENILWQVASLISTEVGVSENPIGDPGLARKERSRKNMRQIGDRMAVVFQIKIKHSYYSTTVFILARASRHSFKAPKIEYFSFVKAAMSSCQASSSCNSGFRGP